MNIEFTNSIGMKFVEVPAGEFLMGSPLEEIGRDIDEVQHRVRLTQPYLIQTTTVTNRQLRHWREEHSSGHFRSINLNGNDQPSVNISWNEAKSFLSWLSEIDSDWDYSLPTEAQWEHAARAGTTGVYYWTGGACEIASYGNVYDLSAARAFPDRPQDCFDVDDGFPCTAPVGNFLPNAFGLYDTVGNVWEMCDNWAYKYKPGASTDPDGPRQGAIKVARGGDFHSMVLFARLANRTWIRPDDCLESLGFRAIAIRKVMKGRASFGSALSKVAASRDCRAVLPAIASPTWEGTISQMFTERDVQHMLAASTRWEKPLDLSSFDSVKTYATKVYSSIRDDRMPPEAHLKWTPAQKATLLAWILAGCPER